MEERLIAKTVVLNNILASFVGATQERTPSKSRNVLHAELPDRANLRYCPAVVPTRDFIFFHRNMFHANSQCKFTVTKCRLVLAALAYPVVKKKSP